MNYDDLFNTYRVHYSVEGVRTTLPLYETIKVLRKHGLASIETEAEAERVISERWPARVFTIHSIVASRSNK
jgi:hypothetical protein